MKLLILLIALSSTFLLSAFAGPKISIAPTKKDPASLQKGTVYRWKKNITATVFWVGETPTPRNPTPNHKSSWDTKWQQNFGGYDNPAPSARRGYLPKAFIPRQNPFYIALPYNDCLNYKTHKPEAKRVIPWFSRFQPRPGKSVCKGRWIQIYSSETKKICYAQWEDCGPFFTDDWKYVFGTARPKNRANKGAGIDISPAVRDYLGLSNKATVHWRFVEFSRVPPNGPWAKWGTNNPFVNPAVNPNTLEKKKYFEKLRKKKRRR